MADFTGDDLRGARFEDADLSGAVFRQVTLDGARFSNVSLTGAVIRGAWFEDVEIDGVVKGLRINGVDVGPLVEDELDRRYPDRAKLRATDAEGFREAWEVVERSWVPTVERARRLPEALLHERVDGEWSFIETLRHLVFCTDAWLRRAVLGDPSPYHPLGLPHDEMPQIPGVPWDRTARPTLEEVLAVRADRMAEVRAFVARVTDEEVSGSTEPVLEPGYPESESYPVRRCLRAVVVEEWEHRLFAERDLDVLEGTRPA